MSAIALRGGWNRVSPHHPCPICGKPDWCGYLGDPASPELAVCMRVANGSTSDSRNGGWLHVLNDRPPGSPTTAVRRVLLHRPRLGLAEVLAPWRDQTNDDDVARLAARLGIAVTGLTSLGACRVSREQLRELDTCCRDPWVWAFPMVDASGAVRGIRLRSDDGFKWSVRGSREGLFLPSGSDDGGGLTLIVEGPTDTAALLGLGISAIGRPSCTGAIRETAKVVRERLGPIVVVADGDAPGRRGAAALATTLRAFHRDVRLVEPPAGTKDARQWVRSGATTTDVLNWIDREARPICMTLTTRSGT